MAGFGYLQRWRTESSCSRFSVRIWIIYQIYLTSYVLCQDLPLTTGDTTTSSSSSPLTTLESNSPGVRAAPQPIQPQFVYTTANPDLLQPGEPGEEEEVESSGQSDPGLIFPGRVTQEAGGSTLLTSQTTPEEATTLTSSPSGVGHNKSNLPEALDTPVAGSGDTDKGLTETSTQNGTQSPKPSNRTLPVSETEETPSTIKADNRTDLSLGNGTQVGAQPITVTGSSAEPFINDSTPVVPSIPITGENITQPLGVPVNGTEQPTSVFTNDTVTDGTPNQTIQPTVISETLQKDSNTTTVKDSPTDNPGDLSGVTTVISVTENITSVRDIVIPVANVSIVSNQTFNEGENVTTTPWTTITDRELTSIPTTIQTVLEPTTDPTLNDTVLLVNATSPATTMSTQQPITIGVIDAMTNTTETTNETSATPPYSTTTTPYTAVSTLPAGNITQGENVTTTILDTTTAFFTNEVGNVTASPFPNFTSTSSGSDSLTSTGTPFPGSDTTTSNVTLGITDVDGNVTLTTTVAITGPPPTGPGAELWIILVAVFASVFLVFIIIFVACCIRKKRRDNTKKMRYVGEDENVMDYAYHPRRPNSPPTKLNGTTRTATVPRTSPQRAQDNPALEDGVGFDPTTKPAYRNYFQEGLRANENLDSSNETLNSTADTTAQANGPELGFNHNSVLRRDKNKSFPLHPLDPKKARMSMGPVMLSNLDDPDDTQPSTQKTYDKVYTHSTFRK